MSTFDRYCKTEVGRAVAERWSFDVPTEEVDCVLCGGKGRQLYSLGVADAVECERCSFKYVNPQLSSQQLSAYYEAHYNDDSYRTDLEGRLHDLFGDPEERRRKIQDRHVEIALADGFAQSSRILDIGSGTGLFFEGLAGDHDLHAIERSTRAASFVEERFSAKVVNCPVEEAGYEEGFFDVINMTYVIEHVKDPRSVLATVTNWLKKDGLLLVSSPNWGSPMARIYREFFRLNQPSQHICLWDSATLSRALEESGMSVKEVHFPYFRTEYFNRYEVRRLLTNTFVRLCLPLLVRLGISPAAKHVLSPPFWGSIMVAEAYKE